MVVIGTLPQPYSSSLCLLDFILCVNVLLILSLKGGEENEDENGLDQFGIVSQGSKVSHGTTAGGETSDSEVSKRYIGVGVEAT